MAAPEPLRRPAVPSITPGTFKIPQIYSNSYRNPAELPEGGVVVIGSGPSGMQIADELLRAGRRDFRSVGPHNRPPRRDRGVDHVWWLGVFGKWDAQRVEKGKEPVTIALSGANGGQAVDFWN